MRSRSSGPTRRCLRPAASRLETACSREKRRRSPSCSVSEVCASFRSGQDFDQALNAFHRVYQHLEGSRGAVQGPGLKVPEHADSQTFGGILRRALSAVSPDTPFKVQMAPVSASPGINVFASFMKQPQIGYYYVFLYYRIP